MDHFQPAMLDRFKFRIIVRPFCFTFWQESVPIDYTLILQEMFKIQRFNQVLVYGVNIPLFVQLVLQCPSRNRAKLEAKKIICFCRPNQMCCCITSEGILTNYMINKFTDKIRWIYLPFLLLIIVFLISLFAMCVWMYKKRQSVSYALFRIHCLYYCCSYSYKFSMDLYFCDPQNRIA